MTKIYTVPEVRQRLAKHIRDTICRVADDIQDLAQREQFKFEALTKADAQFELAPPPGSVPIQGGNAVPPGQLGIEAPQPQADTGPIDPNVGACPLCGQEDTPGSCTCLASKVPAQAPAPIVKNALSGYDGTGNTLAMAEEKPDRAKAWGDKAKADSAKASDAKTNSAHVKESQAVRNGSSGKPWLKAEAPASGADKANPGANKDPSKQQPTKPAADAVLPDGPGDKVKNGDDNKVKKNPLGKAAVPMAKPPSGKVPGGSVTPPMADNASKPNLAKVGLPAAPAPKPLSPGGSVLPKPAAPATQAPAAATAAHSLLHGAATSARATGLGAALGGAFSPPAGKPPVSNLGLAAPKPMTPGVAGPARPAPGSSGLELGTRPPQKPGVAGPAMPPPASGMKLARSESCPFCNLAEHRGDCTKK